jgi:HAD superfamily hydrolase (TIGR01509 family)
MPFRALLFDVGETLWHSPDPPPPAEFRRIAAQRAAPLLAGSGVTEHRIEHFARVTWDAIEDAIRSARDGDRSEPDYVECVRAALRREALALDRWQAAQLLEAIYISGAEAGKAAYDDARDVLLELKRRGFLLATATNRAFGGPRFRCDLVECGIDVEWDAHAVSVEVGFQKPHPAVFEHALRQLRVRPEQALMVGNSLAEDVAGAQRLGIATVWRRSARDAEDVTPDFVIDTLRELLELPGLEHPGG